MPSFAVGYHLPPYVIITVVGKVLIHQVSDLAAFKILCGHCRAADTGQGFLFFCKAVVVIQLAFVITCDFADELIYLSRSLRIYRFSGSVSTQVRRNPPDLL